AAHRLRSHGWGGARLMAEIQFVDVSKVYGRDTVAVRNLNLNVGEGEFVVLVGPSGCGKTTALRMVAGLGEITDGELRMGDRVAVMRDGVLLQVDTPQHLYDAPVNLFVASFVGSPQMNLFEAELVRQDGSLACRLGDVELELPPDMTAARPGLAAFAGGP